MLGPTAGPLAALAERPPSPPLEPAPAPATAAQAQMAYVKLARIKYDRPRGGLTPHLIAYDLMINDDVLIWTNDGMLWNWPEDAPVEPIIDDEQHLEWVREIHAGELED